MGEVDGYVEEQLGELVDDSANLGPHDAESGTARIMCTSMATAGWGIPGGLVSG